MKTHGLLVCGAAFAALASGAAAGPLGAPASRGLSADIDLIEPVHGCHREVLPDRFSFHYHSRDCTRVEVGPLDYEPYGPYGPYGYGPYGYGPYGYGPYGPRGPYAPVGCFWVGRMRVCP
jgi:hypothetical protein